MAGVNMDSLLVLQKLAALQRDKNGKKSVKDSDSGEKTQSYRDIWEQVKREQEEWDKTLNEVDITQYKLALMDSFWSDRHDAQNYLMSYYKRQQRAINQQSLKEITQDIAWLNELNNSGILNPSIGVEASQQLGKALTTALQTSVMASIQNMQIHSFWGL
ncbi:hypothetical protein SAMN02910356_01663 [Selenomonas sp. GACV-9]|uniref:hypothetical protein n=1 Tax=Selenomonas sp. GACV-9 TaxID=3158782 RepID=UPI0008E65675|nr:hypothetical protein SAMN02910356_01663 [Selenomonas ruminantium]